MASVLRAASQQLGHGQRVQWSAHDKPGGQAAQRRLRQRDALAAKARKQMVGVDCDANGVTPAGLIVPCYAPSRRRPQPW